MSPGLDFRFNKYVLKGVFAQSITDPIAIAITIISFPVFVIMSNLGWTFDVKLNVVNENGLFDVKENE